MNLLASQSDRPAIDIKSLSLAYGDTTVLDGIDLQLQQGRTLALLGPSGCGKTTLLRLLAGLLQPTTGQIAIDGEVVADATSGRFVPPERRNLGMVFQDYALWPHMSVAANVAFPLEMARVPRGVIAERVMTALHRVGLGHLAQRSPADLSGGQQQRVAIARAIVGEPRLVLFDEPLSNLDRELREQLAVELAELIKSLSLTAVYVTHDHAEAFTIADQVAVMQAGEIAQLAGPSRLVEAPASVAVAEFLKLGAVLAAERIDTGWRLRGTEILLPGALPGAPPDAAGRALLTRKGLTLAPKAAGGITGRVRQIQFRGDHYAVMVALDAEGEVLVQASSETRPVVGDEIGILIDPQYIRWFPAN